MTVQIMLVAMNDSVRDALADWFRMAIPGCRVVHAAAAGEAVALGRQRAPSLIVIQDGGTRVPIVQTLHMIQASLDAPIIVLTQSEYRRHWSRLEEAGADASVLPWRVNVDLRDLLQRLTITDGGVQQRSSV
jgi:DNA-binding NarL/FixJ family response regulator